MATGNFSMASNESTVPQQELPLEEALRAERQRSRQLEAMLNLSPALIASLSGPDHLVTYANPLHDRLFAQRPFLGRPFWEALPDVERLGFIERLDHVYRTGETVVDTEVPIACHAGDGSVGDVYLNFTFHPVLEADGRVSGILSHAVDVTEQVLTKRRAEAIAFADRLIQNVATGIAYLDRDLVFRVANPVYATFLERSPSDILGRHVFDVVPGCEAKIEPLLRGVMESGLPYTNNELEVVYTTPEGTSRTTYWDFVYYPLRHDDAGPVDGIFVLANEISERVAQKREQQRLQAEQERLQRERIEALELTDQLKDQFLSILSHELRTPVNAIMAFGSILDDEVAGPMSAEQHRYLAKILKGSETLLALIDDLLDMSRIEAGKFTLNPIPMHFPEVCQDVVSTLTPLAWQKGLTLVVNVPDPLPTLDADPQRMGQVLTNLINNAIKFTPVGGRITLRVETAGQELRCEIQDTGIGIAPEDIPKLFQRFTQVELSSTRQGGGTGLGLSIAKALVEAHGGSIGVRSEREQGSTFWFTLPLKPGTAGEFHAPASSW
ncbi:Non-motile and phage-resistance protein [compost metagenome]